MALWSSIALSLLDTRSRRKAQDYQFEANAAAVSRNNAMVQRTANQAAAAIDGNLLRANVAADGMKQKVELSATQAISKARAAAAANYMGAGSHTDVFTSIALQVNAEEAGIQRSLLQEFQDADTQREQLQTAADGKLLINGSQPGSNLQTLLDFGKGFLSYSSTSDKKALTSGVGSWFG